MASTSMMPALEASTEKSERSSAARTVRSPGRHRRPIVTGTIISLVLLWLLQPLVARNAALYWRVAPSKPHDSAAGSSAEPDWSVWKSIEPSEKLVWHRCYSFFSPNLRCARLTVPMDYHRPLSESAAHPKVHLALVLSPGRNRTDNPASYAESPVIINPGGPGGSGAMFTVTESPLLQGVLGGQHDVLGFDPRGVGATWPRTDCFESKDYEGVAGRNVAEMNRLGWVTAGHEIGLINSSDVALTKIQARGRAVSELCKKVSDSYGNESIFNYVNTPNVARDMLSIVHAWDEWKASGGEEPKEPPASREATSESTKGKLVYWGFSYGSLLGATFASMFPDKVGRVMVDGYVGVPQPVMRFNADNAARIVDADHYVEPTWIDSLIDADKIYHSFFSHCLEMRDQCVFYRNGDTLASLEKRLDDLMDDLTREPRVVIPASVNSPVLITASDIKSTIFAALYSPMAIYPFLAAFLNGIVEKQDLSHAVLMPEAAPFCNKRNVIPTYPDDALFAIDCSDKRYKLDNTTSELQTIFERMGKYSRFADVWMTVNINCNGWKIEARDPPMRWDDRPSKKPKPIKTAFPLLFISSTHDPVTPRHAALKMTRKFENASIVEVKGDGHCSILSCPRSLCLIRKIRAYINDGEVPPVPKFDAPDSDAGEWTRCECDIKTPWALREHGDERSPKWMSADETITYEEQQALADWKELSDKALRFLYPRQPSIEKFKWLFESGEQYRS